MSYADVERFTGADGRRKVFADGNEAAFAAMVGLLRDTGVESITMSWSSPLVATEDDDAPAGVPVTWACTVVFRADRHPKTVGTSEPTADHRVGHLHALADALRQLGANVALVAIPDSPSEVVR